MSRLATDVRALCTHDVSGYCNCAAQQGADEIERLNSVIRGQEIKFGFESSECQKRIQQLEKELLDERMIHAACGVIALSDREIELRNELLESQAREAKLREHIESLILWASRTTVSGCTPMEILWATAALKMPYDDTALLEYRKQVLLEAADWFDNGRHDTRATRAQRHIANNIRKIAGE